MRMLTKCYFCGGKVKEESVAVDFWWGEKLVIIKNVPAKVCQQCGEKFFGAGVYKEMESLVHREKKPFARVSVDVMNFKEKLKV